MSTETTTFGVTAADIERTAYDGVVTDWTTLFRSVTITKPRRLDAPGCDRNGVGYLISGLQALGFAAGLQKGKWVAAYAEPTAPCRGATQRGCCDGDIGSFEIISTPHWASKGVRLLIANDSRHIAQPWIAFVDLNAPINVFKET